MHRTRVASLERLLSKNYQRCFRRFQTNGKSTASLRNVAIVAHVDHGKTTLVDQLLRQAGLLSKEDAQSNARVMDSNNLEQERGITILSKCTSIDYAGHKINIIDTPGHQDFGGEVERILSMVDSVCLLMDVGEGPKPQTKFILEKALAKGFTPILVLNKVDRAPNRIEDCQMEAMELFENLGASSETIDTCIEHTVLASAKNGWATLGEEDEQKDMRPLLDKMVARVPPPVISDGPFRMLTTLLEKDPQHGKLLIGRIASGKLKQGDELKVLSADGKSVETFVAKRLFMQTGTKKVNVKEAHAGDIVRISGSEKATVTNTLADMSVTEPLSADAIDPPLVSFVIKPNDSPLRGRDGTKVLLAQIEKRLEEESSVNVTIQWSRLHGNDALELSGRGELQLAVFIENLRREGFEMSVASPKVRTITEDGVLKEPFEIITVDCEESCADPIFEYFTAKFGEILSHETHAGRATIKISAPSRSLIGYMQPFRIATRGTGLMEREFVGYREYVGDFRKLRSGSLTSMTTGKSTGYALSKLQTKGKLFIKVGDEVYDGMVIGEVREMKDMDCNPCKEGGDSNACRDAVSWAQAGVLDNVKRPAFEDALSWIENDELIEVTPNNIRIRKAELNWNKRKRNN